MSRKDYILIAAALAESRPSMSTPAPNAWRCWTDTRNKITDALARDNSRFNRATFIKATEA